MHILINNVNYKIKDISFYISLSHYRNNTYPNGYDIFATICLYFVLNIILLLKLRKCAKFRFNWITGSEYYCRNLFVDLTF